MVTRRDARGGVRIARGVGACDVGAGGATAEASGYWDAAPLVVILMLLVVALRLHELFPPLARLHPALLSCAGGTVLLFARSSGAVARRVPRDGLWRLTLAYCAWALAMVPFSLWPGHSFQAHTIFEPVLMLLAAFVFCAPTPRNLDRIQLGLVAGCAVLSLRLLAAGAMAGGRLTTIGALDSNDVAALLAFCTPLAIALLTRGRGRARLVGAAAVPLMVAAIAATASRGGVIALSVGSLALVAGARGSRRLLLLAALVAGAWATWRFAPPVFRERLATLTNMESDYNFSSYTGRTQIWRRARGYYLEHPVTGVGFNNFPVAEGETLRALGRPGQWLEVHNAYYQAFAELGTVGGLLFLALLATSARRALALWRGGPAAGAGRRPEYVAALLAFCSSAYFLSHAYSWAMFALLGLIAFAHRVATAPAAAPAAAPAPSALDTRAPGWRSRRSAYAVLPPQPARS